MGTVVLDYKIIYDSLMSVALTRDSSKFEYLEKHHIIPKCIGGTNEQDNIVSLTAREHYIAHMLLWKIYKNEPKLAYAFKMMCEMISSNSNKRDYKISSRMFESVRKVAYEQISKTMKVKMLGKSNASGKRSDQSKLNISNGMREKRRSYFGGNNPTARKVSAEGKIYPTCKECGDFYNCHSVNIIYRCKSTSEKWKNFYYVS